MVHSLVDFHFHKHHVASKLNPTDATASKINHLYAPTTTALKVELGRDQQESEEVKELEAV